MSFWGVPLDDAILFSLANIAVGIVETISGGGMLILLPVLINIETPYVDGLFTTKMISMLIYVLLLAYFRYKNIFNFKENIVFFILAFLGGFVGGKLILLLDPKQLEVIVPVVVVVVLAYFVYDPLSRLKENKKPRLTPLGYSLLICFPIGVYDGFLGPASGSMYIASLIFFLAFKMQKSIVITKFLNGGTVLGALFALSGGGAQFVPGLALLQVVFMGIGAAIGAILVVYKADKVARPLIIVVSVLTLLNFVVSKVFFH